MKGWYFTKTLLGCPPERDINMRRLWRGDDRIMEFNAAMKPWQVWQDEALQRVCDELNKLEGV